MRRLLSLCICAFIIDGTAHGRCKPAASSPRADSVQIRGIFDSYEDGKLQDIVEFWELTCKLPLTATGCRLEATSFASLSGEAHLFQWHHESTNIEQIQPTLFKIKMTGRLSPCSGLDLVVDTDQSQSQILDVRGTMQSGTRCQSTVQLKPDFKNSVRKVPPIWNPLGRKNGSE